MSIDIMNRIWWRDFTPEIENLDPVAFPGSDRNLAWTLLAMGDMASDDGFCWPAIETVARKARLKPRSVQQAIKQAVALGILKKRERRNQSSQYVFVIQNLPHVERPTRAKERGPLDHFDEPELFPTGAGDAPVARRRVHPTTLTGASDDTDPRTPCTQKRNRNTNETSDSMSIEEIGDRFFERWQLLAEQVPALESISRHAPERDKALLLRIDEATKGRGREEVEAVLDTLLGRVAGSRWLRGETRDSTWHASAAWVVKKMNFGKIMDGYYVQDAATGDAGNTIGRTGARTGSVVDAGLAARDLLVARRRATAEPDEDS